MRIRVYTVAHNEIEMMPFFMRHYQQFASEIIVYDDASTDDTARFCRSHGADVRQYPHVGMDDITLSQFASVTYREAMGKADWIMWVDADEFIYHPDVRGLLRGYLAAGVELPRIEGWQMVHPSFPQDDGRHIWEIVTKGSLSDGFSKPVVLQPHVRLRWDSGKHKAFLPVPAARSEAADLKLMHFRELGTAWPIARNARNWARTSQRNKQLRLGYQVAPEFAAGFNDEWLAGRLAESVTVLE